MIRFGAAQSFLDFFIFLHFLLPLNFSMISSDSLISNAIMTRQLLLSLSLSSSLIENNCEAEPKKCGSDEGRERRGRREGANFAYDYIRFACEKLYLSVVSKFSWGDFTHLPIQFSFRQLLIIFNFPVPSPFSLRFVS